MERERWGCVCLDSRGAVWALTRISAVDPRRPRGDARETCSHWAEWGEPCRGSKGPRRSDSDLRALTAAAEGHTAGAGSLPRRRRSRDDRCCRLPSDARSICEAQSARRRLPDGCATWTLQNVRTGDVWRENPRSIRRGIYSFALLPSIGRGDGKQIQSRELAKRPVWLSPDGPDGQEADTA